MKYAAMLALVAVASVNAAHEERCNQYCDLFMQMGDQAGNNQTCNNGRPGAATYDDKQACLDQCATFPAPYTNLTAPGDDNVNTKGNNFQCRYYHASVAVTSAALADVHCAHASTVSVTAGTPNTAGPCAEDGVATELDTRCEDYCDNSIKWCAGFLYANRETCVSTCKTLTPGPFSRNYDQTAVSNLNDLACRRYHLDVAAGHPRNASDTATLNTHCPHATYGAENVCGASVCEGFCNLVQSTCSGDNAAYNSTATCLSECASFTATGTKQETGGDSLECRYYHATVATTSDANAGIHCPHAKSVSDVCKASGGDPEESSAGAMLPSAVLVAALAFASMQ